MICENAAVQLTIQTIVQVLLLSVKRFTQTSPFDTKNMKTLFTQGSGINETK